MRNDNQNGGDEVNQDFVIGNGSESDPYQINNWYQLAKIASTESPVSAAYLDSHYILMNDLDSDSPGYLELASSIANEGKGWNPIGEYISEYDTNPFTGSFDGNNYIISDLYINRLTENNIGLFAYTASGSLINNLSLNSVNISGFDYTGSLVARIDNASVVNCSVSGIVNGNGYVGGLAGYSNGSINDALAEVEVNAAFENAGGLLGYNINGSIINSCATGDVYSTSLSVGGLVGKNEDSSSVNNSCATGNVSSSGLGNSGSYIGGLVGYNHTAEINNSYATGNVSGSNFLGGLAGYLGASIGESRVTNSYATGNVTGVYSETTTYGYYVGGLVGRLVKSTVENSYSAGFITGESSVGGLIGENWNNGGTITNSYWDIYNSDQDTSSGGTGLTTSQMTQQNSFSGWDFSSTWQIDETYSYPYLINNLQDPPPEPVQDN